MLKTMLTITTLIIVTLSLSGCFLTEESTPESPFGFWTGLRDGFFFFLRLMMKPFYPIDLFADYRTTSYTIGFFIVVIPSVIEFSVLVGWLITLCFVRKSEPKEGAHEVASKTYT